MKKTFIAAIAVVFLSLSLTGCAVMFDEEDLYRPGGSLADKVEGPTILATATPESVAAMFPAGTAQVRVQQALGSPTTTIQNADGTVSESYTYTFTQYKAQRVTYNSLTVTYDKARKVKTTAFSAHQSKW
jgi:outer membrane protein assembly factor BamE (lipoprotein component of BamABCDE complex)